MANNNEKFLSYYHQHGAAILKHIFFRVSDWELAEDLAQETFLRTWQYTVKNNIQVMDFKKFLYMVANNLIIDYYRQKDKLPLSLDSKKAKKIIHNISSDPSRQYQRAIDKNIELKVLQKYLQKLSGDYRKIIDYSYLKQFSVKEISALTGKSPNYISVIKYRGVKLLKDKIRQSLN